MPRRNHRGRRRPRPRPLEITHDEPVNYEAVARSLIVRGLASPVILGPIRIPITTEENHR